MKITIDTQTDSHKDLKEVIQLLQRLVGESQTSQTQQPYSHSSNMLNQSSNEEITKRPSSQPITDFTAIFADTKKPESKKEEPQPEAPEDMFKILPY